jgi:predicted kinase
MSLIILSGRPGVGKTTIARGLARHLGAVHVRIDPIEQAIRESRMGTAPIDDAGYRVGYAVAEDNLRLGRTVIADSVNPWPVTRDGWLDVAKRAGVAAIEIEIVCSDPREHRRRVEARSPDIPGFTLPTWQDVVDRDYRPWLRERIVIDTLGVSSEQCVEKLLVHIAATR